MVGIKLEWTGALIVIAGGHWIPQAYIVGAVLWVIGCVLMWLDK